MIKPEAPMIFAVAKGANALPDIPWRRVLAWAVGTWLGNLIAFLGQ